MDCPPSTASWKTLGALRRRGQRPTGGIWVTDHAYQRLHLEESGVFAVELPKPDEVYLVAGLGVTLTADKTVRTIEVAHMIASARPALFILLWRGENPQLVIDKPQRVIE